MPKRKAVKETEEPLLRIDNIQGNILLGFNKDFQALLFLEIIDVSHFKRWLKALIPCITTTTQVLTFRRLLKDQKRGEPRNVKATWINIAFSHSAFEQLDALKDGNFKDKAFQESLWRRSADLGDPTGGEAEGNPQNWVVGGPKNDADVVLIIASDDRLDLFEAVTHIETSIYAPRTDDGKPTQSGVRIIFKEHGANLPGSLAGHEHFGFRDGISQPGVRGRISNKSEDFLTLRNPKDKNQGKPGQDLLWPGEFVFGRNYPRQDPNKKVEDKGPWNSLDHDPNDVKQKRLNPPDRAAPEWAEDGSFLVFRRLRQDVEAFHKFLHDTAQKLELDPDFLGAKCVGRWVSGAPILRACEQDSSELAQNDLKNNDFEFRKEDAEGKVCPFASHIRKVYPRDDKINSRDQSKRLNEAITQTHRLLRRGIPYGEPSLSSPHAPSQDSVDRGLLFLSYQTSIENQFEFVQQQANSPDFKEKGAGYDPTIGQNGQSQERERRFKVIFKRSKGKEQEKTVLVKNEWVIPTGGGYFFAPSIEALYSLANPTLKTKEGGKIMAAIVSEDWARIWAHAELDKNFKETLLRNPAAAVKWFQYQFPYPPFQPHDRLFDLEKIYLKDYLKKSPRELKEIAQNGTLNGRALVQPDELQIELKIEPS